MLNRRVWIAIVVFVLVAIGGAGIFRWRLTPYLRNRVVTTLADRLESQVTLATLGVSWTPRLAVSGEGLVIRHRGRTDVPPLIELERFSSDASIPGLIGKPLRLSTVRVTGLRINIPPHGDGNDTPAPKTGGGESHDTDLTIAHLLAEDAQLAILPKKQNKEPKLFLIHRLQLESIGLREQASFEATLTNPIPRGEIITTGTIGPWGRDDPGETPLGGRYTFAHADFSTIHGIGGTLDSTGTYSGRLDHIEVAGETRTPDFSISKAGNPVPLTTKFQAVVDGTNGDTILNRVDATLGHSPMVCTGAIIDVKGAHGHDIKVHVVMDAGRIEDLLRLAVRADQPLITGAVALQADLEIPPGEADVIDKMRLNGHFGLNQARFSSATIQEKIDALSQRARGDTEGTPDSVVSNLRGGFALANSVLRFSSLDFDVPGARVQLAGSYGLRTEVIDLQGTLTLHAKLSQTVTGYKSFLLKMFDPLFRRGKAGAVIPISIGGTRKNPKVGLDVKRTLTRG